MTEKEKELSRARYMSDVQDRFVPRFVQDTYNVKRSEAIRAWFASDTKVAIQKAKSENIRLMLPGTCFEQLKLEIRK